MSHSVQSGCSPSLRVETLASKASALRCGLHHGVGVSAFIWPPSWLPCSENQYRGQQSAGMGGPSPLKQLTAGLSPRLLLSDQFTISLPAWKRPLLRPLRSSWRPGVSVLLSTPLPDAVTPALWLPLPSLFPSLLSLCQIQHR